MIPTPILKVLSSFQKTSVQALLMGGQACVFYGAAEFSRDTDFAIVAEPSNLDALRRALSDLQAEVIAIPPFEEKYLVRGHAIHFRCNRLDVLDMRVDVMSKMRGVAPFPDLWSRRTEMGFNFGQGESFTFSLMSLTDLVQAKKTQRDKDWPMIRRLVDRHYFVNRANPTDQMLGFWLLELRSPELLIEVASKNWDSTEKYFASRPLLKHAYEGHFAEVETALDAEEKAERAKDRAYWKPLREELAFLRRQRLESN